MAAKVVEDKIEEDHDIGNLLDGMKSMNINNDANKHCQNIPLWIQNFESPFKWHTQLRRAQTTEYMIERCLEKLSELNLDEQHFSLRRYSILLKLLLEYSVIENREKVEETMGTIKKSIETFSSEKDLKYEKIQIILDHLVYTTEAHLLSLDGKEEESKEIAQIIVPVNKMSNSNKAGLCALKANFFLYSGYEDSEKVAVNMVEEARALEPENHEWLYLLAKVLRQQRRDVPFNDHIPKDELMLLEKAVQKCRNSKYLQYLAQIYRECATQAHKQHRFTSNYFSSDLRKTVEDMHRQSLEYYKEALELDPNHAANLRRIGYGIMNLPDRFADYDLALECLMKSLKLCYSIHTVHIIGTFYHRYEKDNKKALEYFEETAIAGSHAGLSDMIRVKFIENPEYNPCEDIDRALQKEIKTKNRIFLLAQKSGYFLFIKRDFLKSIDPFNQAVSEDKESKHLTVFKSVFLRMYNPINLYHYMANEALLYLQQNNSSSEESDKEDYIYEAMALIDTISLIHPDLCENDPDPCLIEELCETSKEIKNKEKSKDRSHQYNQKSNFQGDRQGVFQQRGGRGSSSRGGASGNHNNWRGRPIARYQRINNQENQGSKELGNHRDNEQADEKNSGRFSGNSKGRGQYPNRGKQRGTRSDTDSNWRRN